jgi:hypothetical protein
MVVLISVTHELLLEGERRSHAMLPFLLTLYTCANYSGNRMMQRRDLDGVRSELEAELAELVGQRDHLNVRIMQTMSRLKNVHAVMAIDEKTARTIREKGVTAIGLTDAIRLVMRTSAAQPVQTAAIVLAVLRTMGFDFSEYSNPAAAVHTTLKRLVDSGELVYVPSKKAYRHRSAIL